MNALRELSDLLKEQNRIHKHISLIIQRPGFAGHLAEFIAANIFDIQLNENAAQKGMDGYFNSGILAGKTVDIKYHGKHEGSLNMKPAAYPDYYLVLAGPKTYAGSSRKKEGPFTIHFVFLLESEPLVNELRKRNAKIGIATGVRKAIWDECEIFPRPNEKYLLTDNQISLLESYKFN